MTVAVMTLIIGYSQCIYVDDDDDSSTYSSNYCNTHVVASMTSTCAASTSSPTTQHQYVVLVFSTSRGPQYIVFTHLLDDVLLKSIYSP
jgi:hypothetical protein